MTRQVHKTRRRAWKPILALLIAIGALVSWQPIQDEFHRYQVQALLNESLAGRIAILRMRSKDLRRMNTVFVYTPPGYARSRQRYPVVYLLHGCPGAGRDWFVKARAHETAEKLILSKRIRPMILVSADAFGPGGTRDHSEYLNSARRGIRVEDYIATELPRYIDANFRTIPSPDARALVGLSSGGYGAVNIGAKHQDTYHVLASHSGYFDPDLERKEIERMLGAEGPLWDVNNPHLQVAKWRDDPALRIYLDCGNSDELFPDNQQLDKELSENGIKHVFCAYDGGHWWHLWSKRLHYSLEYCDKCFRELPKPLG